MNRSSDPYWDARDRRHRRLRRLAIGGASLALIAAANLLVYLLAAS